MKKYKTIIKYLIFFVVAICFMNTVILLDFNKITNTKNIDGFTFLISDNNQPYIDCNNYFNDKNYINQCHLFL